MQDKDTLQWQKKILIAVREKETQRLRGKLVAILEAKDRNEATQEHVKSIQSQHAKRQSSKYNVYIQQKHFPKPTR